MADRSRKTIRCAQMVIAVTLIVLVGYIIKAMVHGTFTRDYWVVAGQCITIFMQSKTIIHMAEAYQ